MKWSYLPPLMVYAAYGVSGLTGIVGTFFVKDYLDLSPAFLAALAFWAGIPWALKMPIGHVVDLIWRWKALLVWLGAGMIAASLLIMVGLTTQMDEMRGVMSAERWYVLAALLAPTGYMIQDAVADAMTVEAVPRVADAQLQKSMHTTMQTLGRVAVIGGLALVAAANIYVFAGTENFPKERKLELYADVYTAALIIPVLSVLGVVLHRFLKHEREVVEKTHPNWAVLGGSLVFVDHARRKSRRPAARAGDHLYRDRSRSSCFSSGASRASSPPRRARYWSPRRSCFSSSAACRRPAKARPGG